MPFEGSGDGGFGGQKIEFPDLSNLRKSLPNLQWIALAVIVVALVFTSAYTIDADSVGVVLRLGKYNRDESPGLHFKLPFGIERVFELPIQNLLKVEFGRRTVSAGVSSQFTSQGLEVESHMLTGDLNAAVVEWDIQYRIVDPRSYLFKVRNVDDGHPLNTRGVVQTTFRDMSEAVLRRVIGDRTVNEVLTLGRQEIELSVRDELQALCDEYQTGLKVQQVVLQNVTPPDAVKDSFNEVNQAEQQRERLINEAQQQYNQVIPRAEGEALSTIQMAEGYRLDRVNRAEGDAARFVSLYTEYRKAPQVTRQRLYLETMGKILPKIGSKFIVDDDLEGVLPLLNIGGTPLVPGAPGGRP